MSLSVILSAQDRLSGALQTVEGRLGGLEANLRSSAAETAEFNNKWEQTIQVTQTAGMVIAGVGAAITAAMGKATQAAMIQEDAERRLGVIYGENADRIIELAAAYQQQTRYGDEAIIEAAAIGATYQNLRGDIEPAIEAALNMSEAYGMDLVQAMHMLGRASGGMVGNMRRVGIMVDAADVKARGMTAVYEQIAKETSNAAFATDSASKSLDQMRNAVGDLWESLGFALLPSLREGSAFVKDFAERAIEFANTPLGQTAVQWAAGLGLVMVPIGGLLLALPTLVSMWGTVAASAATAWAAMTGPVGLAIAGVVALTVAIYGIATAADRARQAQEGALADLEAGALTSTEALERMREQTRGLSGELRDVRDEADDTAQSLRDLQGAYDQELDSQVAKSFERIIRLQDQRNLAVERYGEQSKQALEAENRLLEEQQKRILLLIAETERAPVSGTGRTAWLTPNEDLQAQRDAIHELQVQYAALDDERRAVLSATEELGAEEGELSAVTRELTADENALADAHEKAGEAADAQARAERDAARDVESATQRIADAERAISDAVEDRAQRVEDADRRVADARQALADAHESAADRIANAEERAARGVESAEQRVARIRKQLAEIDAPRLTEAQRKEQRRKELQAELQEAQQDLVDARTEGEKIVADAQKQASKMIADAQTRVADAEVARARAIEDANRRVEDAQRRRADAVQALALAEERASERIAAAIKKVTKANEDLAEAQGKVNATRPSGVREGGQPQAMPVPIQPVYVAPREEARYIPQVAPMAGASAGGGDRVDLYLHSDGGFVLDTARNAAGQIVGSVNGKNAVVHIVRDMFARR